MDITTLKDSNLAPSSTVLPEISELSAADLINNNAYMSNSNDTRISTMPNSIITNTCLHNPNSNGIHDSNAILTTNGTHNRVETSRPSSTELIAKRERSSGKAKYLRLELGEPSIRDSS